MKAAGVQAVVSMLSDSELATYAQPLVPSLTAAFGAENYVNIDAKGDQGVCVGGWAGRGWSSWTLALDTHPLTTRPLKPRLSQLRRVCAGAPAKIMRALKAARAADKTVLVHCWGGERVCAWQRWELADSQVPGRRVLSACLTLCTHRNTSTATGGGRTGLVQAAWLVSSGMSPEAAAEAVTAWGSDHGLSRRVDVAALKEFLAAAGEQ